MKAQLQKIVADGVYELLSNLGDDLKAMSAREDKTIIIALSRANDERLDAFIALAESGVVKLTHQINRTEITLLI